jgi:hypothetical protein
LLHSFHAKSARHLQWQVYATNNNSGIGYQGVSSAGVGSYRFMAAKEAALGLYGPKLGRDLRHGNT